MDQTSTTVQNSYINECQKPTLNYREIKTQKITNTMPSHLHIILYQSISTIFRKSLSSFPDE